MAGFVVFAVWILAFAAMAWAIVTAAGIQKRTREWKRVPARVMPAAQGMRIQFRDPKGGEHSMAFPAPRFWPRIGDRPEVVFPPDDPQQAQIAHPGILYRPALMRALLAAVLMLSVMTGLAGFAAEQAIREEPEVAPSGPIYFPVVLRQPSTAVAMTWFWTALLAGGTWLAWKSTKRRGGWRRIWPALLGALTVACGAWAHQTGSARVVANEYFIETQGPFGSQKVELARVVRMERRALEVEQSSGSGRTRTTSKKTVGWMWMLLDADGRLLYSLDEDLRPRAQREFLLNYLQQRFLKRDPTDMPLQVPLDLPPRPAPETRE